MARRIWKCGSPSPSRRTKEFVDQAGAKFKQDITRAIGKLREMLERQQTSVAPIDEPPLFRRERTKR